MGFSVGLLLVLVVQMQISVAVQTLIPPVGNSLALIATALDGKQSYRCFGGNWLPISKRATLTDVNNRSMVIGSFWLSNFARKGYVGQWNLINSDADRAESGHSMSQIAGKEVASVQSNTESNLPDFLARASAHRFDGTATRISYIAQLNTTGGALSSDESKCGEENSTILRVRFEANFHFWSQDSVPPVVPEALAIPTQRPVEGFFGQGVVAYVNDRESKNWTQKRVTARLYDVPGGVRAGAYVMKSSSTESNCLLINNPNAFEVCGKLATDAVPVTPTDLQWSLIAITNSTGSTILGPFTYVQVVSTWGGLPPPYNPSLSKNRQVWHSPFTAIFWLYKNQQTS